MSESFIMQKSYSTIFPLDKKYLFLIMLLPCAKKAVNEMNHIIVRRISLVLASVSFGVLFSVVLLVSALDTDADEVNMLACKPVLGHQINGTSLMVEQISSYDGSFYEDGTGREVFDTMAVLVRNQGDQMIYQAWIELEMDSGRYQFEATMIPPFSSILIPEKNAQKFLTGEVVSCQGWTINAPEMAALPIEINLVDKMTIDIENLSANSVPALKVFYRTYLFDQDIYVGGKAYCKNIEEIPAYDHIAVALPNYYASYSMVVSIQ